MSVPGDRVPSDWNGCFTAYPHDRTVHELFREQCAAAPCAIAIQYRELEVQYRILDQLADQYARRLRKSSIGPGSFVGLCMVRSPALIAAMLGILKAGAAYVPLDPEYPDERLRFMIDDASIRWIVAHEDTQERLASLHSAAMTLQVAGDVDDTLDPVDGNDDATRGSHVAYMMYTSGSSGTPKGVVVGHRAIVRLVRDTNYCDFHREHTFLQFAPISFDASTFEIWGPLLNGGRLVIMPERRPSLRELGDVIKHHGVTTLWLTSGLFNVMVDQQLESLTSLRQLVVGGDILSPSHVRRALDALTDGVVINGYGPTESTTFACCHRMPKGTVVEDNVPIGRPISNTTVYILDERLCPVPIGVAGELFIGGDGLAEGYWNRPEQTWDRFISHALDASSCVRLYRTGDQARFRPDGALEFLGRLDRQVKISGYRVEPGEVEAALTLHAAVQQAVVVPRGETPEKNMLVAYVVMRAANSVSEGDLKRFLADRLPSHLIPSIIVRLDHMPLTPNGKVDRAALPPPDSVHRNRIESSDRFTDIEVQIAQLWEQSLGFPVGLDENFFDLGGTSLQLIRLHAELVLNFHVELSITDMFQFPTVRSLARRCGVTPNTGMDNSLVRTRAQRQQAAAARNRLARADKLPRSADGTGTGDE